MALAEVQKVQILAHGSVKMELLTSLQDEGLIQLEKADFEELELQSSTHDISEIERRHHRLSNVLDYLSLWEERGLIKRLFTQKPQLERQRREEILNSEYMPIVEELENVEREKNELVSEIRFLEKEEEYLVPLQNLDLPIKSIKPTDSTEVFLGRLPLSQYEAFQEMADEAPAWYKAIDRGKRSVSVLIVYHKSEQESLELAFKELNLTPLFFTGSMLELADEKDRVEEIIIKIEEEIDKKRRAIEDLEKYGGRLFAHREELMLIHDVLLNERERILSSGFLGETERVFYLEGWVCSSDVVRLESKMKPFEDLVELKIRPPHSGEDPPVILENPKAVKPFEVITKLYGLPQRGSLDPTLWLAPFFFLFVGLCVSEAGYGFLIALSSFLILRFAKPKGSLSLFLKLLLLLGISTIILGILVGGWFGFPIKRLMVLDPLQDPLSFLILALILGFIQVWFGTLLNMINGIINKNYLQSIAVQGGWLLLLPSLVLYLMTKTSLWGILALLGAFGIIFFASPSRNPFARFFGGLYSLYDISRYLADILSYSRLLALGLATSVIAMVVNTLCQSALGIPWLGWLFAALIFVGGHLFNLGISLLGGFVHSMRLQFVEFFSKFFKAGGRPFKPFALESKYIDFI